MLAEVMMQAVIGQISSGSMPASCQHHVSIMLAQAMDARGKAACLLLNVADTCGDSVISVMTELGVVLFQGLPS